MEENNKLFVFEKKEVILIFIFIVLIAVISFTLGVRTGKQLSLKHDDYSSDDIKNINLKSIDEEYVDTVVKPSSESGFEKSMDKKEVEKQGEVDTMENMLRDEMEKLAKEKVVVEKPVEKMNEKPNQVKAATEEPAKKNTSNQSNHSGKFTIQLFSHQSQESAQDFADGFILKGYDVIINEVVIPGKGKWYRVGIGLFDTLNQAKDYLDKEKKLFLQNKYIIQQI